MQKVFGIDIGGTSVKMGCFTAGGERLDEWAIPTRTAAGGSRILPDIAASLEAYCRRHGLARSAIAGAGIGVPGPVDAAGIVDGAVNLGWGRCDPGAAFTEATGLPAAVGNDANVAALGECWQGAGRGSQNLVMLTLGTGIGGGVVVNGELVAGCHGAAGEIGHFPVNPDEAEACGCGKRGCLEQYASAAGIVRMAGRALAADPHRPTRLREEALSAVVIFEAARAGDALALALVDRVAALLGRALATIAGVLDPEVFVIGGGMANAGEFLRGRIERAYRRLAFPASRDTPIQLARLGNDAGIVGAAKLALGAGPVKKD
jgi:glucokinase